MAEWLCSIKIGDLHGQFQDGKIPIEEVANKLADRLDDLLELRLSFMEDGDLDMIIDDLRFAVASVEDYDAVLEDLYDFCDEGHRIWLDPSR